LSFARNNDLRVGFLTAHRGARMHPKHVLLIFPWKVSKKCPRSDFALSPVRLESVRKVSKNHF
jgi:hypothetical protein